MPIAFDPESTIDITLKADANRPESARIKFRCRALTVRQRQRVRELLTAAIDASDANGAECEEKLRQALAIGVIGPVNATDSEGPVPMTLEGLERVLTPQEVWDLALEYPGAVGIGEFEKKRSGSPAASAGGSSAAPAAADAAPTSPAATSPSSSTTAAASPSK